MEPVYVFGHRNPDTDSVCAAITLAYLKNKLGIKSEPRVIGHLNQETKFVLDYFNVIEPAYLSDVKIQIKDLKYNKKAMVNELSTVSSAANIMIDNTITGLPIIDSSKQVRAYVNLKDVAREFVSGNISNLDTSYDNIVEVLNGKEVVKIDDEITGNLIAAAYSDESFKKKIKLKKDDIVIVADRSKIIDYAVLAKVKLMIIVGNNKVSADLKKRCKKNNINVISTPMNTFETANAIKLCNYVIKIAYNQNPIVVDRHEYLEDFKKRSQKYGHTNYPVVNNKNECVGMLTLKDLRTYEKKKVILVDHNQNIQSVEGIEEAEILEVVDHHNIGTIGTNNPINFRVMPVGSTCTLIYMMYKENKISIPKKIAGLMLAAVISDTLALESPTTTKLDVDVAIDLMKITGIDMKKFSKKMFKEGSSLRGKSVDEVLFSDYKEFKVKDDKIFVSHILSLDFEEILRNMGNYILKLNELSNNRYKIAVAMITDVTKNGSYLLFSDNALDLISSIYNKQEIKQGMFIKGLVSRKKQLVPNILELL